MGAPSVFVLPELELHATSLEKTMRIYVTSVFVDDQSKALDFYSRCLGFTVKHDIPMGVHRWLTVVSPEAPDGTELLLEPSEHPAVKPYKSALVADGIPAASFQVDSVASEYDRLRALGVAFTQKPMDAGPVCMAVLDDTCGNLIQLIEMKAG
jgi:predicted enzyme related to lactoylglutathione lyase